MESNRLEILTLFAKLKRHTRQILAFQRKSSDLFHRCFRVRNKLEAAGSPFNQHRIAAASEGMRAAQDYSRMLHKELAQLGEGLTALCHSADLCLTLHDKAQVLGISHLKLQKYLDGLPDDEGRSFMDLIFPHNLEGENDPQVKGYIPRQLESMPLWNIAYAHYSKMIDEIYDNPEHSDLREEMSEVLRELFPGLPRYEMTTGSDGSAVLKRLPPRLKLIKKDEDSRN